MQSVIDLFAGIGLVSSAFQKEGFTISLASDYSEMKEAIHRENHPSTPFIRKDIRELNGESLPQCQVLHGSFPCTDTSVAGYRKGCRDGRESPMYWEFHRVLQEMKASGNKPSFITIENVEGLLTSNSGRDLRDIIESLNQEGYFVDIALINSLVFVPQSRSRLFLVGRSFRAAGNDSLEITSARPKKVVEYIRNNSDLQWDLYSHPELPACSSCTLDDIVDAKDENWWPEVKTRKLLSQMFDRHLEVLIKWKNNPDSYGYGTVFRRMRTRDGIRQSTAELRSDGIAGCLRTPKGGSAKQILVKAGQGLIQARHLNPLECSRLMGAEDFSFDRAISTNDYLYGFGDSVCVPVMQWVIRNLISPVAIEGTPPNNCKALTAKSLPEYVFHQQLVDVV